MICLALITYYFIKDLIPRIKRTILEGVNMFEIRHLSTLFTLLCNYASIAMYVRCIIFDAEIKTPVGTEKNFQVYVDEASYLLILLYVSCVCILFMSVR